jgi:DNA-binding transcriptional LysR family regulator
MASMRRGWESLEPSWLATFLAVAEHLNYTRAAKVLFVTQPAVSRQMKALQHSVGVRLVEQVGKHLALTDAGRAFRAEAQRLRGDLARAGEVLDALRAGSLGRLRIGASTTPGLYVLPPVLNAFQLAHPNVEVTLRIADTRSIEEALVRNEIDLGFVGGRVERPELVAKPLVGDEVLAYVARSHPLARRRSIRPEELAEHTFLLPGMGSATRRAFESWLTGQRIRPSRVIEIACPEGMKPLVAAGLGIGINSCRGLAKNGGPAFKLLAIAGLDLRRQLHAVRHRDKAPSASADELVRSVLRDARRCRHDGQAHG